MGFIQKGAEGSVATQKRVYLIVVMGVVAVIGSGLKNRIKVDGVNSEVFQIVELFIDTQQIAAFKAFWRWGRIPGFKITRLGDVRAPGKTVRKNLVENSFFYPIGRRRGWFTHSGSF